jgi:hypothetical protein
MLPDAPRTITLAGRLSRGAIGPTVVMISSRELPTKPKQLFSRDFLSVKIDMRSKSDPQRRLVLRH